MSSDFTFRHPRLTELFGIDLRTLALFRFLLGAVLFCNLLLTFGNASAFWTDFGVMPRALMIETDSNWRLSLHMVNGEYWFIVLLLGIQTIAAAMLALGWHTRLATIVSFVLWGSLINRNPMILIGGDLLISCLLFWSMFLPTGSRFSVDAAVATNPPPPSNLHVSWASMGLLLQVMYVYFFSAILKNGSEWLPDLSAVYYALSLDRHVLPFGRLLNEFPWLTKILTFYVWWLELLGPILIFSPLLLRPLRLAIMLAFILMHVGFILSLELGHFSYVSITSLTLFMGGWVWDAFDRRHQQRYPGTLRIYYDRDCGFCLKICLLFQQFLVLPRAQIAPAQDNPRARALLEANNSWVVIDADEQAHLKWAAFTVLLRQSPLLGWLWPLARRDLLVKPGNRVYDFVARHRTRFAAVSGKLLPQREVRWEVSRFWQRVAAAFVVLVLAWNMHTVNWLPKATYGLITPPFRILRIDQLWNMFAPYPLKDDGWMVIPGRLADGSEIDLMHPKRTRAPDFGKPALYSQDHGDIRWLTYRGRLWESQYQRQRMYYGKYLCRNWNADKLDTPEGLAKRLMTFKIVYMLERTPPMGQSATVEQIVLWRHECFPEITKGQIP